MRRLHLGLVLAVGVGFSLVPASRAQAQALLPSDPFQAYFGFYLPHQAAIAAQATPLDTINAAQAASQRAAAVDRSSLYDVKGFLGDEELDPLRPFTRTGRERMVRPHTFPANTQIARQRGNAPRVYYGRAAQYYPTLQPGVGPNRNLAVGRAGRGMSNMPAMPGIR